MPADDDIARLLPQPPPPRAARREMAIDAAMRRFDGETAAAPVRPSRPPIWARINRTQIAAFASVALVAVIGIPLALTTLEREHASVTPPPAPVVAAAPKAGPPRPASSTPAPGEIARVSQAATTAGTPTRRAEPAPEWVPPPAPEPQDCGKGECGDAVAHSETNRFATLKPAAPSPPPPPPPPEAVAVASRAAAPAPISSGYAKVADAADERSIVVTGSRVRQPAAAARRGDWNACTVNDPGRSLAGCGQLVDPGARGATGQAAAHVADGLSRAWEGDLDGAVREFDAAIALKPRLAIAYLNRGIVYHRLGDTGRALADLGRAIRYAPSAARGYYNRSLIFEQTGDAARARADADKAVEIDARYRAALE